MKTKPYASLLLFAMLLSGCPATPTIIEMTTYVAFQTEVKSGNVESVVFKEGQATAKYKKPLDGSTTNATYYRFDYVAEEDKYHDALIEMLQDYNVEYSFE